MTIPIKSLLTSVLLCSAAAFSDAQDRARPQIPIGIFLGRIEEGARIFTPVRLLPFDHPEAEGHQFPNALQLQATELDVLPWLGHQAGYELRSTLMRYPKEPSPLWPYKEFSPPDTSVLRSAQIFQRPETDSPLKGLKAVLYVIKQPVCFIVDTRSLTLEEREMKKATTMGLDIDRSDFLSALAKAENYVEGRSVAAVIFQR